MKTEKVKSVRRLIFRSIPRCFIWLSLGKPVMSLFDSDIHCFLIFIQIKLSIFAFELLLKFGRFDEFLMFFCNDSFVELEYFVELGLSDKSSLFAFLKIHTECRVFAFALFCLEIWTANERKALLQILAGIHFRFFLSKKVVSLSALPLASCLAFVSIWN